MPKHGVGLVEPVYPSFHLMKGQTKPLGKVLLLVFAVWNELVQRRVNEPYGYGLYPPLP